jgi:nuclear pore complex protein Nup205
MDIKDRNELLVTKIFLPRTKTSSRIGRMLHLRVIKGILVELDEVGATHKLYPAMIPFLNLLSTLIHTPERLSLKDIITNSEPLNTIPHALG